MSGQRDMSGMSPEDYQSAAVQSAEAKGRANATELQQLREQITELREFCKLLASQCGSLTGAQALAWRRQFFEPDPENPVWR